MEVEAVLQSAVETDEALGGLQDFFDRRVLVFRVELSIDEDLDHGNAAVGFPDLLEDADHRKNVMRRSEDERIPTTKRESEVLDSRKDRIPMIENSKQVIERLKLIIISSFFPVFRLEITDLDISVIEMMLQDLESCSSLTLALFQLLPCALTQQHRYLRSVCFTRQFLVILIQYLLAFLCG